MLDKVLLIVLAYFIYRGYKTGLFRTLNSIVGYIAGVAAAALNYKQCAILLDDRVHIVDRISPLVEKKLALPAAIFKMDLNSPLLQKNTLFDSLPGSAVFKKMVALYLPDMSELSSVGVNNVGEGIIYVINHLIIDIVAFLLVFVLTVACFKFLIPAIFSKTTPRALNFIDKAAGALLGMVKWVFAAGLVVLVLVPISLLADMFGSAGGELSSLLNQSLIAGYFITFAQKLF